jgi:hypothetical protein
MKVRVLKIQDIALATFMPITTIELDQEDDPAVLHISVYTTTIFRYHLLV